MNLILKTAVLLSTLTRAVETMSCETNKCSPKIRLQSPSISLDSTWKTVAQVKVTKIVRLSTMKMVRITRYTSYCSEVLFDEYNQCRSSIGHIQIDEMEAIKAASSGTCQVGRECDTESDCWGDNSHFCLQKDRTSHIPPTPLTGFGKWFKFPYHTCTQYWGCEIVSFTPKIQLKPESRATIVTPLGEEITFKLGQISVQSVSNYTIVLNLGNQTITEIANAQCISHRDKSVCLIENKDNFLVEFDKNGESYINEKMIKLMNHMEVAKHNIVRFNELLEDSPLTIGQAREMQEQILYDNLQAHLNTKVLEKGIEKLYSVTLRLISFLASKHPHMLSSILNIPGVTTDSTASELIQCPCFGDDTDFCSNPQKEFDSSKGCLRNNNSTMTYINFTWANGIDWNTVPEIDFYSSVMFQGLMEDLKSRSYLEELNHETTAKDTDFFIRDYSAFMSNFLKRYSWIASWFSLVLNIWLMHIWCSNAVRRL